MLSELLLIGPDGSLTFGLQFGSRDDLCHIGAALLQSLHLLVHVGASISAADRQGECAALHESSNRLNGDS